MDIPDWLRERVITLQVVNDSLSEEIIKAELASFGVVEKVQFFVSRNERRHAFVTFADAESATRALSGTSRLPIKPPGSTWFNRYEPPTRFLPQLETGPKHRSAWPVQNPYMLMGMGVNPSYLDGRQWHIRPGSSLTEPYIEEVIARYSAYIGTLERRLDDSDDQVVQLQATLSHVQKEFQSSEGEHAKEIQVLRDSNMSLLGNLGEAYKNATLSKERLAHSEKMLSEERERIRVTETTLRQRMEDQDRLIAELRSKLSSQSHCDDATGDPRSLPINDDSRDAISLEGRVHPLQLEEKGVPKPPSHKSIPDLQVSVVGPSLLDAFCILDQIVSGALTDAFTVGPDEPMRKKRKLGDV